MDGGSLGQSARQAKPKVELHIHLEGAVRPATVWELSKKRGVHIPGNDAEDLAKTINDIEMGDLVKFLATFKIFLPSFIADREAIRRIAYELCEDKCREGVVYLEMRLSPHLMGNLCSLPLYRTGVRETLSARDVVASVAEGIRNAERDFAIKARIILITLKKEPAWATECLQLCKEFYPMTVAMDIGGQENVPLHSETIAAFQEAKRCGIHRTVHAGEGGPASNVKEAIEVLQAERIGHGYRVLDDNTVYQMVKDKGIHLEVCPTSSVYTGACDPDFKKHPCIRFQQDSVSYSLSTDDPLVFQNSLNDEFEIAEKHFGLTEEEAAQVTLNAAHASFLPEDEKEELIKQLKSALDLNTH